MTIEFDRDKDLASEHKLPFAVAGELFDGPFVEEEDSRFDYGETRFSAMGPIASLGGRICVVVYTWRGHARRVISFRKANDREIRRYRDSRT